MLSAIAALATALVVANPSPQVAAAKRHSCGTYSSDSIYARAKVFAIRGVGCRKARRVAKRFDNKGDAPGRWQCFLGHGDRRLFSCGHPPPPGGGPITSADHALLARGVGPRGGGQPPEFAGLAFARTCIPGPIGPPVSSRYSLRWSAASDDRTPPSQIVYEIYQAAKPGGQDFSQPTYTTAPGVTSFSTPPLSSEKSWHFVVRARDQDGNRDHNRVEREGQNLCV